MSKKSKIISIISVVIAVIIICLLTIHTSFTDRINPFISQEISYAQIPKGTQKYKNIEAYNPETKKNISLKKVDGYDPSGQYIAIQHKGQYVKSIKYITKKQFMKIKE